MTSPRAASIPSPSPEPAAARAETITVEGLRTLVHAFYGRIREDAELGPIFERIVGRSPGGWPPHLDKMTAFWSAVLLGIPGFSGNPRLAHARIVDLEARHFARWLFLFRLEVYRIFADEPAEEIVDRAEMMAVHLQSAALGGR
jgi:hemoglobin